MTKSDCIDKRLLIFQNEQNLGLQSVSKIDNKLVATAVGPASGHSIAIAANVLTVEMVGAITEPQSKFLKPECDLVLFLNSPRQKAHYGE